MSATGGLLRHMRCAPGADPDSCPVSFSSRTVVLVDGGPARCQAQRYKEHTHRHDRFETKQKTKFMWTTVII